MGRTIHSKWIFQESEYELSTDVIRIQHCIYSQLL